MFNFFKRFKRPPIGTVIVTEEPDRCDGSVPVVADFVYSMRVLCPRCNPHRVEVSCSRSQVKVTYRCLCGDMISLFSPPVRSRFNQEYVFTENELMVLQTGPFGGHTVDCLQVVSTNDV